MRVGVTRATLRQEVFIEAQISTQAGHTDQMTERVNAMLNRVERTLATKYTWLPLKGEQNVTVLADASTGTLPSNFNFTRINQVHVQFGSDWLPVKFGITPEHRSIYGPNDRASPIQRIEVNFPGTTNYEVWPVSPQDEVLRFSGERAVGAMASDSDTCTLDADVLVLLTAGELLANRDKDLAQVKLSAGNSILDGLKGRMGVKLDPINLAARPGRVWRPYLDFIPPGGA